MNSVNISIPIPTTVSYSHAVTFTHPINLIHSYTYVVTSLFDDWYYFKSKISVSPDFYSPKTLGCRIRWTAFESLKFLVSPHERGINIRGIGQHWEILLPPSRMDKWLCIWYEISERAKEVRKWIDRNRGIKRRYLVPRCASLHFLIHEQNSDRYVFI